MVSNWFKSIENELHNNSPGRHQQLIEDLADWLATEYSTGEKVNVNFICTHNSRRSQFAQTWFKAVQAYLGLDIASSYSGGTEVTTCNERTIAALQRTGLSISAEGAQNPVYTVTDSEIDLCLKLWSKVFDDQANPAGRFAAVMTCDHADQNCPFIPGAAIRVPLTYTDPKYADDTDEETAAYDRTCKLIATDMLRLLHLVKKKLPQGTAR